MTDNVYRLPGNGAPDTREKVERHLDDTEAHAIENALRKWANNGQVNRVRKFHKLTAELLAKRGHLEIVE